MTKAIRSHHALNHLTWRAVHVWMNSRRYHPDLRFRRDNLRSSRTCHHTYMRRYVGHTIPTKWVMSHICHVYTHIGRVMCACGNVCIHACMNMWGRNTVIYLWGRNTVIYCRLMSRISACWTCHVMYVCVSLCVEYYCVCACVCVCVYVFISYIIVLDVSCHVCMKGYVSHVTRTNESCRA